MAVQAIDLMIRDVHAMEVFRFTVPLESRRIIVTTVAALSRHLTCSLDNMSVTPGTLHIELFDRSVIKRQIGFGYDLLWNLVAESAAGGRFTQPLIFEVAEEAG